MFKEFKKFALNGNVLDVAVAFILGVSFQAIVNSLVEDIIMPVVGLFTGGTDFSDKKIILSKEVLDASGEIIKPENAISYGKLIDTIIVFLIVAFILFLIVRAAMKMKKKKEEEPAAPPEPTKEEILLTEIRDVLKENKS